MKVKQVIKRIEIWRERLDKAKFKLREAKRDVNSSQGTIDAFSSNLNKKDNELLNKIFTTKKKRKQLKVKEQKLKIERIKRILKKLENNEVKE